MGVCEVGGRNDSEYSAMAAEAAERIDAARALGEQLTFLDDGAGGGQLVREPADGPGRPAGSKNRNASQLRDWLAAKGMRLPEDVLAELAGLGSRDDATTRAMAQAERVLAWAIDGARPEKRKGGEQKAVEAATLGQRMSLFVELYKQQARAAEALLPYGLNKVTPDTTNNVQAVVIMPSGAASAPGGAPVEGEFAPPPMPQHNQQNQEVSEAEIVRTDGDERTETPND